MARAHIDLGRQPAAQASPAPTPSSQVLEEPRLGWWSRTGAIAGGITGAVC